MTRGAWTVRLLGLSILGLVLPARATSLAPTTLGKLASGAHWIVVGKVARVLDVPAVEGKTVRVAEVEVLECLKGVPAPGRIWYLAEGVPDADTSDAVPGEKALLFLADPMGHFEWARHDEDYAHLNAPAFWKRVLEITGGAPLLQLCWSGNGRLPVDRVEGTEYATLCTWLVRPPADMTTIPGAVPWMFDIDRRVPLDALLAFVKRRLEPFPLPGGVRAAAVHRLLDELDADTDVCPSESAERLLAARGESLVPALLDLLADPAFPRRDTVAEALYWIGDPGLEALRGTLRSKDVGRRRAAAFALEWVAAALPVDPEEITPEAVEAARRPDPDVEVRARMVGALALGGGSDEDEPIDAAAAALEDGSPRVRRAAARSLLRLQFAGYPPERAEGALRALAQHEDRDLRREVWDALAWAAGPDTLPAALRALDDPDRVVRVLALFSLHRIPAAAATERLIGALASEDPWARSMAAFALGGKRAVEAVAPLVETLADPDPGVVRNAVDALGEIGPAAAAAVPALERLLEATADPDLRSDIEDALEKIRG